MEKEIRIKVAAPVACTEEQFEEWAKFNLDYQGSIASSNPLSEYYLKASEVDIQWPVTVGTWTERCSSTYQLLYEN